MNIKKREGVTVYSSHPFVNYVAVIKLSKIYLL